MSTVENTTNNKFPPPPSSHNNNSFPSPSVTTNNNNLHLSPSSPPLEGGKYHRSSNYYFEGGSVVFLANNVLFRLQPSLLAADPGVEGFEFESLMKSAFSSRSETSLGKPGTSDTNPLMLPADVRASQFRDFLLAVLGRIGDSGYTNLVTAAQNTSFHRWQCIGCFANIGNLAVRFGMDNLDGWVQLQIRQIFRVSVRQLAAEKWEKEIPVRVIKYMQITRITLCRHDILTYIQLFICESVVAFFTSPDQAPANLGVLVDLFQDKSLAARNPGLFGYVFAAILSLGHRSPIWTDHMTRGDRRILYAAHTDLTCLGNHQGLQVSWLARPTEVKDICLRPECSQSFDSCWNNSFAACKALNSPVPLEDIHQIVRLPRYRRSFADRRHSWLCGAQCAQKTISRVDAAIERLFCGLTEKHRHWANIA